MLKLKLSEAAHADIAATSLYYRNISPRLAHAFRLKLNHAITTVRQRPGVGSLRFTHLYVNLTVRAWSLDRFPYQILYRVEHDRLHLLRVTHERSDVGPGTVAAP